MYPKSIMDLKSDCSENVDYDFIDFPSYIRTGGLSSYPNYSAVSHWHDDIEFIAVLSGHMLYNVNGKIVPLKEGDGIIVNSRQLHYGFSEDFSECNFICILLHPLLLCSSEFIERTYITPVLSNEAFPFWLLTPHLSWQKQILDLIKEMYSDFENSGSALQIQSIFFQIWTQLYSHTPKEPLATSDKSSQLSILKDMVGFIQRNYRKKITLNEIAASGKVCKSSCCAIFQNYLNQTPIAYLIDYRLKKSVDLLNSTEMSITEIGLEVGFTGSSYFAETFRAHYGCSPKKYRQNTRISPTHSASYQTLNS